MANIIKKAFFRIVDKSLTQTGYILSVRKWGPGSMYEIDLHLPETDMAKWKVIPRIKVKVSDFEYRDYSPCNWDVIDRTCTVFIEAGHEGPGSKWVKDLNAGDPFLFAGAAAASLPRTNGKVLCIGDGSALGHFLAFKQLANQEEFRLEVIISLDSLYTIPPGTIDSNPEFQFIRHAHQHSHIRLDQISTISDLSGMSSICIAGYTPMVQELRKSLKDDPTITAKISGNGFWR